MRNASRFAVSATALLAVAFACMSAQAAFTGKVVTEQGAAAAGAKVRLYYCHDSSGYGSQWLSEAQCDDKGAFTLPKPDFQPPSVLLKSNPVLRFYLVGTLPGRAAGIAEAVPGEDAGYTIALEASRTVGCAVLDQLGKPVAGVDIFVQVAPGFGAGGAALGGSRRNPDGLMEVTREIYRTKTDATGKCVITDVPTTSIILRAVENAKGVGFAHLPQGAKEATISFSGNLNPLHGAVTYKETGKPAAGMVVHATPRWQRSDSWCISGADGKFDVPAFMSVGRRMPGSLLIVLDPKPIPTSAAAVMPLANDENEKDLNLQLVPGRLVSGKVVNSQTKQPVAGAIVGATATLREGAACTAYRLTDAQGAYTFRFDADAVELTAIGAPAGYVTLGQQGSRSVDLADDVRDADVTLDVVKEVVVNLVVKDAAGVVAPNVQITGQQLFMPIINGRTDVDGQVRFGGLAEGKALKLYLVSADRAASAALDLPLTGALTKEPILVQLKPAKTVQFLLEDADGLALPGFVLVNLFREGEGAGVTVGQGRTDLEAKDKTVNVTGLLPDMDYAVRAFAQGGWRPADGGQWTSYRFSQKDDNPKLVMRFQRLPQAPIHVTRQQQTADDYKRDLDTLKAALWSKKDPVQASLTWYAEKRGLATADSERMEVKRLTDIVGVTDFTVSGIAFSKEKVWVGTDKGLLVWDRKEGYWAPFAVGRLYADMPVTDLTLDGDTLHVTVQEQGKNARRFDYSVVTQKWEEIR